MNDKRMRQNEALTGSWFSFLLTFICFSVKVSVKDSGLGPKGCLYLIAFVSLITWPMWISVALVNNLSDNAGDVLLCWTMAQLHVMLIGIVWYLVKKYYDKKYGIHRENSVSAGYK